MNFSNCATIEQFTPGPGAGGGAGDGGGLGGGFDPLGGGMSINTSIPGTTVTTGPGLGATNFPASMGALGGPIGQSSSLTPTLAPVSHLPGAATLRQPGETDSDDELRGIF